MKTGAPPRDSCGFDRPEPAVSAADSAVRVRGLSFQYPVRKTRGRALRRRSTVALERLALDSVDLEIFRGEVFGLLGPNGGGKTTLFRILCTSLAATSGSVSVLGLDPRRDSFEIRRRIGVVFQNPSLDRKLTVRENLVHHARLYGLAARERSRRIEESLKVVGLPDRAESMVEELSGGLARRVEIAKCLLHQPELLILDEPSAGLDPAARADLWRYLLQLPGTGVTVLATTHLMEEAERCSRVAILDGGRIVALGRPDDLRGEIGGDVVTIDADHAPRLAQRLREKLGVEAEAAENRVRFEQAAGRRSIATIVDLAGEDLRSISVSRPTLEDVFLKRTGHRFWAEKADG
jgi:ABC-2 type transport system ATP-binding protein